MNKHLLLGVAAAVVVMSALAWLFFYKSSTSSKPTVVSISWHAEAANPSASDSDDYRKYEQTVSVDVTFEDETTKRYFLGNAYGCDTANVVLPPEMGRMKCYFALTSVDFAAYFRGEQFIVERLAESAEDGSVQKTVMLEI